MRSQKHTHRKKRNKWIRRIIYSVVLIVFFILGTGVGYYGSEISRFLGDVSRNTPEELQDTSEQDARLEELHPFSVLLMGLDDTGDTRRSDTLIVATINPNVDSVKLVSIPRDTLITLPNSDRQEKINALYTIYGVSGTIDFVEDYMDIPISYYATLNFDGLVDLVNAVGGITVDAPFSFTVQDSNENMDAIQIEEGIQTVDGEHALGYARMRKQDPRGDWGRQERQREVIQSLADELLSFDTFANFSSILDAIRNNLQTNLSGRQIWTIANNYTEAAQNVETLEIAGAADTVYFPRYGLDLYVWEPYEESLEEIKTELREHLELSDSTGSQDESEVGLDKEFENFPSTEDSDDSFSNPQEDDSTTE